MISSMNRSIERSLLKIPKEFRNSAENAIQSLLGIIPYAGGPLSTIFGNYLQNEKFKRLIVAVDHLAKKVAVNDHVLDQLLTESQVCELLEKHLLEIGITADETKQEYLKNSLVNGFTSVNEDFNTKEIFLSLLKNLTVIEILLLKEIYLLDDPFVDQKFPIKLGAGVHSSGGGLFSHGDTGFISSIKQVNAETSYLPGETTYMKGGWTLEEHFDRKFGDKWSVLKGACYLLDGKGLSSVVKQLKSNVRKIVEMRPANEANSIAFLGGAMRVGTSGLLISLEQASAIEGSRTSLGSQFIKYISA
jgi:hypothetical protein